jgi:uncharacterized membrane protein
MKNKTLFMVQLAVFTAIELIFCFTPLGSIPIGPGIVATLAHIPALIVALVLGRKAALYMGTVMGISSLIVWTFMPPNPAVAFVFSPFVSVGGVQGNIASCLICIVPRMLFPVFAAWLFGVLKTKMKLVPAAAISAVLGTLSHSVMVLGAIYLAFYNNTVVGNSLIPFVVAWGGVNALLEMLSAGLIAAGLILPLNRIQKAV